LSAPEKRRDAEAAELGSKKVFSAFLCALCVFAFVFPPAGADSACAGQGGCYDFATIHPPSPAGFSFYRPAAIHFIL
jgi:hypothetical protein